MQGIAVINAQLVDLQEAFSEKQIEALKTHNKDLLNKNIPSLVEWLDSIYNAKFCLNNGNPAEFFQFYYNSFYGENIHLINRGGILGAEEEKLN